MNTYNFNHILKAIDYLEHNREGSMEIPFSRGKDTFNTQYLNVLFRDWAGVELDKFNYFLRNQYRKRVLNQYRDVYPQDFTPDSALNKWYNNSFLHLNRGTEEGPDGMKILYSCAQSQFGKLIVASTDKGICYIDFINEGIVGKKILSEQFPHSPLIEVRAPLHDLAVGAFNMDRKTIVDIDLHLHGTEFQMKVWQELLKIPVGKMITYARLASNIADKFSARAVGTAIGQNTIAYLIPCHRVIYSDGKSGNYRWGSSRKKVMLAWEAVQSYKL